VAAKLGLATKPKINAAVQIKVATIENKERKDIIFSPYVY
jgi:hypothetical protein